MIITPKYQNSIYEMIEEDDDLVNLVDGYTYFRVWSDGEFKGEKLPEKRSDGSIVISTVAGLLLRVPSFALYVKVSVPFTLVFGV